MHEANSRRGLGVNMPFAQAVIDAGGDGPPRLTAAINQRMLMMLPGQIMEIVSLAPTAPIDIASWCRHTGHELVGMVAQGNEFSFWIRKCEP